MYSSASTSQGPASPRRSRRKTWAGEQGGAPHLAIAIEIVSPNEGDAIAWDEKIARYHELGIEEFVRFDPEEPQGLRLRAWDRVQGDLVERVIAGDRTPCLTLGLAWTVVPIPARPVEVLGLRLVDDEGRLLETSEEREKRLRTEAEARIEALEEERRRR